MLSVKLASVCMHTKPMINYVRVYFHRQIEQNNSVNAIALFLFRYFHSFHLFNSLEMCIENAITFTESLTIPGLWFIECHLSVQLICCFCFLSFVLLLFIEKSKTVADDSR